MVKNDEKVRLSSFTEKQVFLFERLYNLGLLNNFLDYRSWAECITRAYKHRDNLVKYRPSNHPIHRHALRKRGELYFHGA